MNEKVFRKELIFMKKEFKIKNSSYKYWRFERSPISVGIGPVKELKLKELKEKEKRKREKKTQKRKKGLSVKKKTSKNSKDFQKLYIS